MIEYKMQNAKCKMKEKFSKGKFYSIVCPAGRKVKDIADEILKNEEKSQIFPPTLNPKS